MKIKLYTAVFGNYDPLILPINQDVECTFYYFTDDRIDIYDIGPTGRKLLETLPPYDFSVHPIYHVWKDRHPITASMVKNVILRYLGPFEPLLDCDLLIYLDGNVQVNHSDFVSSIFIKNYRPDIFLIIRDRPDRNCAIDEIRVSKGIKKYRNVDFDAMVKKYNIQPKQGVFSNNIIGYVMMNKDKEFAMDTVEENMAYAIDPEKLYWAQGQVLLPYLVKKYGIQFVGLPNIKSVRLGHKIIPR